MRRRSLAVLVAVAVTGVGSSALAWQELTESTSDSTTTTTDVTLNDNGRVTLAQQTFLSHNYMSVMRDGAVGGGEYLRALGTLLGCSKSVQPRLFRQTKLNHDRIFAPGAKVEVALAAVKRVLAEDEVLASSCRFAPPPALRSAP